MKIEKILRQRQINKILAVDGKVKDAVKDHAESAGERARAILAAHFRTGASKIEVHQLKKNKYGHIDWLVSLVDDAAMSIEFGHMSSGGNYVPGIYAITRGALGL